jgi:hypothetical protein
MYVDYLEACGLAFKHVLALEHVWRAGGED